MSIEERIACLRWPIRDVATAARLHPDTVRAAVTGEGPRKIATHNALVEALEQEERRMLREIARSVTRHEHPLAAPARAFLAAEQEACRTLDSMGEPA